MRHIGGQPQARTQAPCLSLVRDLAVKRVEDCFSEDRRSDDDFEKHRVGFEPSSCSQGQVSAKVHMKQGPQDEPDGAPIGPFVHGVLALGPFLSP